VKIEQWNDSVEAAYQKERVLTDVRTERSRQDNLWGVQNHDSGIWALILGEEFGEACQAALDVRYGQVTDTGPSAARINDNKVMQLRSELIQVAAVAVAWVESIDREKSHEGQ
jgi:hypothetical protein